jgi:phosphate uptake regulator
MRRKIIKQGVATLTISLPAKWTKKFGLKPGDEISLEEKDSALLLSAVKTSGLRRETIDLSQLDALLKRIVAGKYLKGSDEIEVKVNSHNKARIIQQRVREMIGMEVVQQGKNFLVVKDISGAAENTFDPILRRVFFMINAVAEESIKAFRRKDTDLGYLEDMETNINRFTDHCFRILNKYGYPEHSKTPVLYSLVILLEQLADEYKALTKTVVKNKLVLDNSTIALVERIQKLFRQFETLFYGFSHEKAIGIAKERDSIVGEIDKRLSSTKSVRDAQVLRSIKEMAELIVRMMGQALTLA